MLDGFFAFVILDTRDNSFYIARSVCCIAALSWCARPWWQRHLQY